MRLIIVVVCFSLSIGMAMAAWHSWEMESIRRHGISAKGMIVEKINCYSGNVATLKIQVKSRIMNYSTYRKNCEQHEIGDSVDVKLNSNGTKIALVSENRLWEVIFAGVFALATISASTVLFVSLYGIKLHTSPTTR